MNERRVVVTGTGVITALGDSRRALHQALCSGRHGLKRVELFDDPMLNKPLAGEITRFEPTSYLGERNFRPLDRTSQLLVSAAKLALDDAHWTPEALQAETVGLVVGTTFCSLRTISSFDRRALEEGPSCASPLDFANTVINAAAGQAGIWHSLVGVNSTISTGITSGLEAIIYAAGLIREGHEQAILAGGVEELCVESLLAFQRAGLLFDPDEEPCAYPIPFDSRRSGFALAEGAALLMLEELDAAVARGASILAEFKGAASCFDCTRLTEPTDRATDRRADCIANAIATALDDVKLGLENVDAISVSANGNHFADRAEAIGCERAFKGNLPSLPVTGIKSMVGESMGASAAIQAIDAIETLHDGRLPGIPGFAGRDGDPPLGSVSSQSREIKPKNLLISSVGLDGHCCALVMGS
jgi:3-oxoacyl-[acyl-carrier-protein] synthase II